MGVYYKVVNVTKKQQYEPANLAVKYGNFIWYAEEVVFLLLGQWKGDEVRLVSDSMGGAGEDLYDESEDWPKFNPMYASPDGNKSVLSIDRNGMTKMLKQFVQALGPETVAVALDQALTNPEIE